MIAKAEDQEPRLSVAIVGGGIGGLCLAIGLLNEQNKQGYHNVDIQIYEAAPAFAEIGAGVSLSPNSRRSLKLLGKGAEQAFEAHAIGNGPGYEELKHIYRRYLWGAGPQSGEWLADAWCVDGQASVHRAHFLDALVKLVPEEIVHFNKRLVKLEEGELEDENGNVGKKATLYFTDDTVVTADCIIGCDGVHSKVRKHLVSPDHPAYNPSFSGTAAYRGLLPMDEVRAVLGVELTSIATIHVGPGGSFMTYPTDSYKLFNILAFDAEVKNWSGEPNQTADRAYMKKKYGEWGPIVQKIIGLLDRPDTKVWSLWELPPMPTFTRNRVALTGDAAHATTPYHGAGAGQAIEDALVLSRVLARVQNVRDLGFALTAYDRVRRPRAQRVVKESREAARLYSLSLPGVMDDPVKFRQNVEQRYDWTFNHDVQLMVEQAHLMVDEMKLAKDLGREGVRFARE